MSNNEIDSVLSYKIYEKNLKNVFLLGASIFLIVLPAILPLGFSPDSFNYYATLNLSPDQFSFYFFEPGYWFIIYINKILFNGSWMFFSLFFSVIYVTVSLYLIKKYSINPFISIIIFIFLHYPNFSLIQIRNGVAIAFLWWALFNLLENKKSNFIIKILIATLFHYTSIIFLLLLFLKKEHINKKIYFILPLVGLFLGQYVFNIDFYQFIINYLPSFLNYKASNYLYHKLYGPGESSLNNINLFNLYYLFLITIYYIGLLLCSKNRYFITLEKLLGFSIFTFFCLKTIPVFSFRISNIFCTFTVFLIPYILQHIKRDEKLLVYNFTILIIVLLFLNIYVKNDAFNWALL